MKMPEFTAEASLYKTDEHYHMRIAGNSVSQVVPQSLFHQALLCWRCWQAGGDCICGGRGCECA
jgi:hypothetical protein